MFKRYYPCTTDASSLVGGPFTYGDYSYDFSWNGSYTLKVFHRPLTHVMLFGNVTYEALFPAAPEAKGAFLNRFIRAMQGRNDVVPVEPLRVIGPANDAGNEHRVPRPTLYPYSYREHYYMLCFFDDLGQLYSHLICFNHHIDVALLCLDAAKGVDDSLGQQLRAIEASNCRNYILFIDHPDRFDAAMRDQLRMAFAQYGQAYDELDIVYGRDDETAFPELIEALQTAGQRAMKPKKERHPLLASVVDWEFADVGFTVQVKLESGSLRRGQKVEVINYTSDRPSAVVGSVEGRKTEKGDDTVRIQLHMPHESIIRNNSMLVDAGSPLTPYRYLAGRFYLCHYERMELTILEKSFLDLSLRGTSSAAVLSLLDTDILGPGESARVMLRLERPLLAIPRDVVVARIMDPPYRHRQVYGILKVEEAWDGQHG